MAYVAHRKAYAMVPHPRIEKSLQMIWNADNIVTSQKEYGELNNTVKCRQQSIGRFPLKTWNTSRRLPFTTPVCFLDMVWERTAKLNYLLYMDDISGHSEKKESLDYTLYKSMHVIRFRNGVVLMKLEEICKCDGIILTNGEWMKGINEEEQE